MAFVKLVRESMEKTTMEMLNIKNGIASGELTDRLILTDEYGSNCAGYRITKDDLDFLYEKKKKEYEKIQKTS